MGVIAYMSGSHLVLYKDPHFPLAMKPLPNILANTIFPFLGGSLYGILLESLVTNFWVWTNQFRNCLKFCNNYRSWRVSCPLSSNVKSNCRPHLVVWPIWHWWMLESTVLWFSESLYLFAQSTPQAGAAEIQLHGHVNQRKPEGGHRGVL